MRAKYGIEYKWDYRLDGGSSIRSLSTQQRNCRPACRRPFPACSTALCVWLLAVEAAAVRSARVRPRVLCPRSSTRTARVWGWRMITDVRVHAVAPGAARQCSYPLQKLPCRLRESWTKGSSGVRTVIHWAGLMGCEGTKAEDYTRVRIGLSLAWKAS